MSEYITIRNLSKSFGEKVIFDNLSLDFECGTVSCIKGPSGRGKTTLLRIIAGLEKPTSGTVDIKGKTVSVVFQENRLSENFNAVSNVRLVTGKKMKTEEIIKHLKEVGLEEYALKPVNTFSGGMKRRLSVVRAICFDADLILMDEPFKGLDEKMKTVVMDYVKKHIKGKTLIFVTHDDGEAEYMGGKIFSFLR